MALIDIYQAVMNFDEANLLNVMQKELDEDNEAITILNEGLIAPLNEVGKKFSQGEMFLPEMMMAAQCVKKALNILRPYLIAAGAKPKATIVLGTVKGDLHDIGKNLVGMMLEGAGFQVIDLGVDVDPEAFITTAKNIRPDIIGLSALLTTTMVAMEKTVSLIRDQGLKVKIIIGGAPITPDFAEKIGADGYGKDAPAAVKLVQSLISN